MTDTVDAQAGGWYFRARRSELGARPGREWLGWCAQTPRLGTNPIAVPAHLDCRFAHGPTSEAVLAKLRAEVLN